VTDARHLPHDREDECVIEFVLATPVEEDVELGGDEKSKNVFRLEGSHDLSEAIRKYGDETKGDDVLVIMPDEKKYAIVPRRRFHETARAPAATLRSDIAKYIQ
jgi:hypothetical protein